MYDHIVHFKFPGQGQRDTPVADLRTLLEKPPAAPARHRSPAEPTPRSRFFPAKKNVEVVGLDDNRENFFPVVLWVTTAFGEPARQSRASPTWRARS